MSIPPAVRARLSIIEADLTELAVDAYGRRLRRRTSRGTRGFRTSGAAPRCCGYPPRLAADVAIATITAELAASPHPAPVIPCMYDAHAMMIATDAFATAAAGVP
jgi:hypothetical protein